MEFWGDSRLQSCDHHQTQFRCLGTLLVTKAKVLATRAKGTKLYTWRPCDTLSLIAVYSTLLYCSNFTVQCCYSCSATICCVTSLSRICSTAPVVRGCCGYSIPTFSVVYYVYTSGSPSCFIPYHPSARCRGFVGACAALFLLLYRVQCRGYCRSSVTTVPATSPGI